jgi:hypothetical protein
MIDDTDDFAMLTPPTRPGPCKAATAQEVDPVEARLEKITSRLSMKEQLAEIRARRIANEKRVRRGQAPLGADWMPIEVRHGSGKVKV